MWFGSDTKTNDLTQKMLELEQYGIEYILGIQPTLNGLRIDPCIPHELDGFALTRVFRGATYHISVDNSAHVEKGIHRITINGEPIQGNVLPVAQPGETVDVKVIMG